MGRGVGEALRAATSSGGLLRQERGRRRRACASVLIRAEQLRERLSAGFCERDVPLLVEWPDGQPAVLSFVFSGSTSDRLILITDPRLWRARSACRPAAMLADGDAWSTALREIREQPAARWP